MQRLGVMLRACEPSCSKRRTKKRCRSRTERTEILTTGLTPAGGGAAAVVIREAEPATEVGVRSGGEEQEEPVQELAVTGGAVTAVPEEEAAGGLAAVGRAEMMDVTEVGVEELLLLPELLKAVESITIPDREEDDWLLLPLVVKPLLLLFASRVFNRFASAVFVFGVTCVLLLWQKEAEEEEEADRRELGGQDLLVLTLWTRELLLLPAVGTTCA